MRRKKFHHCDFVWEPIGPIGRFPFEQRSSPPRSAAQQHWPGSHSLPPLEACRAILHHSCEVTKYEELPCNSYRLVGKRSGHWLQHGNGGWPRHRVGRRSWQRRSEEHTPELTSLLRIS